MKITKNLSLSELTASRTAKRLGIDNTPTKEHLENLKEVGAIIFQPLRDFFKTPIYVSSGYRSEALNKAIGGAKSSQHMKGEALDLDADVYGVITNADIFHYIKDNLVFDQLILENVGNDGTGGWIHVSYSNGKNRGKVMVMDIVNGKSKYRLY